MSRTADGTTIEVSTAAPATFDDAGYAALTFTEVGMVVDVGEIGATFADVTTYNLSSRDVGHLKGSRDWNETPLTVDNDRTDAGQVILRDHHDGANTDNPVAVKVTHQNGDVEYFSGLVFTFTSQSLAQDTIYRANVSMRITAGTYVFTPAP
jgi:hypothetical protein